MAREDWETGWDEYFNSPDPEPELNDILFGNQSDVDTHAQQLMLDAVVHGNDAAYSELVAYMMDTYGIDFEDAWDWEDFRGWYDAQ